MAEASESKHILEAFDPVSAGVTMDKTNIMEAKSLLLCDYLRLRKVGASKQKVKSTNVDKKLKVLFNHNIAFQ